MITTSVQDVVAASALVGLLLALPELVAAVRRRRADRRIAREAAARTRAQDSSLVVKIAVDHVTKLQHERLRDLLRDRDEVAFQRGILYERNRSRS